MSAGLNWDPEGWWTNLDARTQVAVIALVFPGVLVHEITHAVLAVILGGNPRWNWDHVAVDIRWPAGTRRLAIWITLLGPALIGLVAGVEVALVTTPNVPWYVAGYGIAQWAWYTLPVAGDVAALLALE